VDSYYDIRFSSFFERQWLGYGKKARDLIRDKIELIKENPYRFQSHKGYHRVFKVKLNIESSYSRLMYAVYYPDNESIMILGIFPRGRDYKDFERMFGFLRK
jgi:mRNA-degrading endonuclease RelE of RelBE toxin-antitoxin system